MCGILDTLFGITMIIWVSSIAILLLLVCFLGLRIVLKEVKNEGLF